MEVTVEFSPQPVSSASPSSLSFSISTSLFVLYHSFHLSLPSLYFHLSLSYHMYLPNLYSTLTTLSKSQRRKETCTNRTKHAQKGARLDTKTIDTKRPLFNICSNMSTWHGMLLHMYMDNMYYLK